MNYYKILEVDKDASPEIIEKAYKTLVKKYHPDLQESNLRAKSEEKIKLINEAYEVLSNPDLRANYDKTLVQSEVSKEDFDKLARENEFLSNELNKLKYSANHNTYNYTTPTYSVNSQDEYRKQSDYQSQIQQAKQKAYYDAYIQDLKNRGYRIRYKKTPKEYFKNFLALLITFSILFLLWQIPFIRNFFISLFDVNQLFQSTTNT